MVTCRLHKLKHVVSAVYCVDRKRVYTNDVYDSPYLNIVDFTTFTFLMTITFFVLQFRPAQLM